MTIPPGFRCAALLRRFHREGISVPLCLYTLYTLDFRHKLRKLPLCLSFGKLTIVDLFHHDPTLGRKQMDQVHIAIPCVLICPNDLRSGAISGGDIVGQTPSEFSLLHSMIAALAFTPAPFMASGLFGRGASGRDWKAGATGMGRGCQGCACCAPGEVGAGRIPPSARATHRPGFSCPYWAASNPSIAASGKVEARNPPKPPCLAACSRTSARTIPHGSSVPNWASTRTNGAASRARRNLLIGRVSRDTPTLPEVPGLASTYASATETLLKSLICQRYRPRPIIFAYPFLSVRIHPVHVSLARAGRPQAATRSGAVA